jgi:hypothetical protein
MNSVVTYGRLRSSRPGEYVLLDSTRLDVFVMEPVTLRWVLAELTGVPLPEHRQPGVRAIRLADISAEARVRRVLDQYLTECHDNGKHPASWPWPPDSA